MADNKYILSMTLNFPDATSTAEEVVGVYLSSQMSRDLEQLAWNLVNCNNERQPKEFGGPRT